MYICSDPVKKIVVSFVKVLTNHGIGPSVYGNQLTHVDVHNSDVDLFVPTQKELQ